MLSDTLSNSAIQAAIRAAKTATKPRKLFDGKGLFLLLKPKGGSALWRFKYMTRTSENVVSLGAYPDVSLKRAREKRDEARALVADGGDPSTERKQAKLASANTFEDIAEEYIVRQEKKKPPLAKRTVDKARWQLREFLNPHIGRMPITEVSAADLLTAIRRIEARGKTETAHKTKELAGRVFAYAISTGRAERNVARDLTGALTPRSETSYAAITDPVEVGKLLRAVGVYAGQPATKAALQLAPHVFLRPGELRGGEWAEIDFKAAQWRIPGRRMKMKRDHIVPLSHQSISILKELQSLTDSGTYVFPAIGAKDRPLSENTLGKALRLCGYSSEVHVPHGFRSTASTLLHELGYVSSDIELQLAHKDSNKVRGIYNRAERIKERTVMMQEWSDHLDKLRTEAGEA